jgi:hypothetical protein
MFTPPVPHPPLAPPDLRDELTNGLGGEFDPWRTFSLLSDEPWAPKNVQLTQEIPDQGVSLPHGKVFGYLLKGAAHCFDFRSDWPDGATSRALFVSALRKWLAESEYPKRKTVY